MSGKTIGRWLRACFLGSVGFAGCDHLATSHRVPTAAPADQRPAGYGQLKIAADQRAQAAAKPPQFADTRPEPKDGKEGPRYLPPVDSGSPAPPGATGTAGEAPAPAQSTSGLGHAPDYSWLVGRVERWGQSKMCRLRYASVEEIDPHGGSVTLVGEPEQLENVQDGQVLRVRGRLLNPDSHTAAPAYQVEAIETAN
jgi:hypothetical protein